MQGFRASLPGIHQGLAAEDRADGKTTSQRLAAAEQVGLHSLGFNGEPGTGTPETGKDLVSDEHNTAASAEIGELANPSGWRRKETLAPHHRLEENATDVGITLDESCDFLDGTAERQALNPGMEEGPKGLPKLRARGDLERAEGQSVVCRVEGQDPRLSRRETGRLECNLHSVGPGGREIDTRVLDRGSSTELACQPHPRGVSVNVAEAVKESRGLLTNRG